MEPKIRIKGFKGDWEKCIVNDIANRHDNLRIPVKESERQKGNIPFYGQMVYKIMCLVILTMALLSLLQKMAQVIWNIILYNMQKVKYGLIIMHTF